MRFFKKYRLEILTFLDLELFLWSMTRRYTGNVKNDTVAFLLGIVTMVSGAVLIRLCWLLSRKWRRRAAERVQQVARGLMRRLAERVMLILDRLQLLRGKNADDMLSGRTYIDFDLHGDRSQRGKYRRPPWRQLENERERLRWVYASTVEHKLRRGSLIRPSDTPGQIEQREDNTPEQVELFETYNTYRYDLHQEPPAGTAEALKQKNGR